MSRWGFFWISLAVVFVAPLLVLGSSWVVWVQMQAAHVSTGFEILMLLFVILLLVAHLGSGVVLGNWFLKHQKYLSGTYCTPAGGVIYWSLDVGWMLTAALFAMSSLMWITDMAA